MRLFHTTKLKIEQLISLYSGLQKKVKSGSIEYSEMQDKYILLEEQVTALKSKLEESELKCRSMDSELTRKTSEFETLQASTEASNEATDKVFHHTLDSIQDTIDHVSEVTTGINASLTTASMSNGVAVDRVSGMDMPGLIIHNVNSTASQIHSRVNDFSMHLATTLASVSSTVDLLIGDINNKTHAYQRLQLQLKEQTSKSEESYGMLTVKLNTMEHDYQQLVSESKQTTEKMDTLHSENRQLQIVCNEFSQNNVELQNELSRTSDYNVQMKYSVEDADNVCNNLKQHIELLQNDVTMKEEEVNSSKRTVSDMQQQIYNKDIELEKLTILKDRMVVEKNMLETSTQKSAADIETLKKEFSSKNVALRDDNNKMKLELDKVLHAINLTMEYYKISTDTRATTHTTHTNSELVINSNLSWIIYHIYRSIIKNL